MDDRFIQHNQHYYGIEYFIEHDPQLRRLSKQKYIYHSDLIEKIPMNIPGIYTIGGGRQIGKTTLLKQWMLSLLKKGIQHNAINFFSGELIDDHHALLNLLQRNSNTDQDINLNYIIIDEVTYIREWDKAVKYAADAGLLENTILILIGSDLILIQEARMRFPGRRGSADQVDFHLYPLSFHDTVILKRSIADKQDKQDLYILFNEYLQHGGYLTAINELALKNLISPTTLRTYSDWIRGDMLRRGKQERYLQEILTAIIKRLGSQVSWHSLAKDLSIDHHKTVADYINLLSSMDAVFVQSALLEDKLAPAPKKAKKIVFNDPFIFHAVKLWLYPDSDPYNNQIIPAITDSELSSKLVEACVTTHYRRLWPTYYIKAEGEVDIAYVNKNKFWPIEIKWTNQIRPHEFKQIQKYSNARIFTKSRTGGKIGNIQLESLPEALFHCAEL